jgi:hypothetical protein
LLLLQVEVFGLFGTLIGLLAVGISDQTKTTNKTDFFYIKDEFERLKDYEKLNILAQLT